MGKEVDKPKNIPGMFNLGDDVPATTTEVEVYDKEHVTLAITFIESHYQLNGGKLPKFEDLKFLEAFGYGTKKRITKLLNSEEIYIGLSRRGIAWPRPYDPDRTDTLIALSPQQQHCVLIVTDPTRSDNLRKRLELVGISYQTYRNWMKQPAFGNAIRALSEDVLQDNLASVHTSMTAKAMAGDVTAARLVYELSGRHDPSKQQMLDLSRIIGLVLESLTRHVTDPIVLQRLGNDLDIIIAGDTPQIEGPQADFSFVSQIVDAVEVPDDAEQNPAQENSAGTLESGVPERTEPVAASRDIHNVPEGFFDL
jgi:hypothetical protein